ncbi:PorV/PorQ family protein, partial [candidate division KSB1 bacterium]|nr:PorV/PorQ family protein [candidate division KSB1 bacterium]
SVSNFALGFGYARMLTDRVAVGMIVNYLRETIWHSTASGIGLNFGVQYQLSQNGLALGASVSNFGPRMKYSGRDLFVDYDFDPDKFGDNDNLPAQLRTDAYQLPTIFRFGISYPLRFSNNNTLLVAVDAKHPADNDQSLNLGAEWMILDKFALRGGYRDLFLKDSEGGLVFGAGMQIDYFNYTMMFDYAWADYGRLNQTHRFTLGLGF